VEEDVTFLNALIEGEIPDYSMEKRYLRKDGSVVWAILDVGLVRKSDGTPAYFVSVVQDITERKGAEKQLRKSEERHRSLISTIPAVIYRASPDEVGRLKYVSPQAKEYSGFSPEEFIDNPGLWEDRVLPADREQVLQVLRKARESAQPFSCEYRMRRRDGEVIWVREAGRLVRDEEGQPLYLQGVVLDITDSKETERELEEANRKLERTLEELRSAERQVIDQERQRALSEMASGIAHDFNNALSTIRGFTDLLLESESKLEEKGLYTIGISCGNHCVTVALIDGCH
jgi:PAS domain S-box-containing protein